MTHFSINPYESPRAKNQARVSSARNRRRSRGRPVVTALGTIVGAITCYALLPTEYESSLYGLLSPHDLPGIVISVVVGGSIGAMLAKWISLMWWPSRSNVTSINNGDTTDDLEPEVTANNG